MSSAALSAMWNWRSWYWKKLIRLASVPSSAASIWLTTSASSACRVTVRPAPWVWVFPALPTVTSSVKSIKEGIWIEKLDSNPGELIPEELRKAGEGDVVKIDLNQPMADILKELTKYPVSTRLSLNGTIIVGRDIAHAKLKERLDRGEDLPQYIKDHPIYYAGPAKTPQGMACGSMGPTTAGRMDPYVDLFQSHGAA